MLHGLKKFSLPEIEEKVLEFWKKKGVVEKILRQSQDKQGKKFIFYEGPPTANGRPGFHHILARSFKDIIPRYKSMRGYYVQRKAGWDTHGLPVELEVEKELGLKSKKEIEKYGIAAFNKKCKESVWKYKDEWEKLTERIGFWLDLKNPYVTYEPEYIETVWWIISQIEKRKLLYQGHKVLPWCTRCGTVLSSHELALGYKEVKEKSVYVKFKLKKEKNTYILSWTTTPWTLPGNVALAINPDVIYSKVKSGEEIYILAKERLSVIDEPYEVIKEIKGKDLIGLNYEPLFDIKSLKHQNSYKIYPADFVTTEEGTGVVHIAVMYGEDDYQLGQKVGLPQHHTVDEQGNFMKEVTGFGGLYVKDKKTEEKIIKYLEAKSYKLKAELYTHEYPFCWRCQVPLLYYARDSWFIAMSKLRKKLLAENEKINWIPAHLKKGRFGEWLKEAKDWAISRERYWGTPLPIWQCKKCDYQKVIGSLEELVKQTAPSSNRYLFLRHGEAETNHRNVMGSWPEKEKYHLTLKGLSELDQIIPKLKRQNIDLIIASDLLRTKETAKMVAQELGIKVSFDQRLREIDFGIFNGKDVSNYRNYFSSLSEKFTKKPPQGENLKDLSKRSFDFIKELEKKYNNKTILIISHEYPIWILETVMRGWSEKESILQKKQTGNDFIETGKMRKAPFLNVPRNEEGFIDLHRPYVDEILLKCSKCDSDMKRIKEVMDVWFDSGAMPFAQAHWPFVKGKINFPADYISEGIDQTRGWFYTLLAISVLLKKKAPYKNIISLGLILDKYGQKMSKSKGNTVDPWKMIQKYGADTVRWYFYTVNPPGEPKRFDENDLAKTLRRFILMIYNSFYYFDIYGDKKVWSSNSNFQVSNILDHWILARLNQTILQTTEYLEKYEIGEGARNIESFVEDLSRWYIRRSRKRFSVVAKGYGGPVEKEDYEMASQTLFFALFQLSKLMAPFTPFFAEALFQSLTTSHKSLEENYLSVHLGNWPEANKKLIDKELLTDMKEVRRLASLALAKRAEIGIKVRQPLSLLKIKNKFGSSQLLDVLKSEVNVKKIIFDKNIEEDIELDTHLTHELREEGWLREFIRIVQGLRQDAKLRPKDKIILTIEVSEELKHVISTNEKLIKQEVSAQSIEYRRSTKYDIEIETKLDQWPIWVAFRKLL